MYHIETTMIVIKMAILSCDMLVYAYFVFNTNLHVNEQESS